MCSHAFILTTASLLLSLTYAAPIVERQDTAPTVTLSSGVLVGTTTQYIGATATNNKFLGIPYAKSPPLRFGLPEAAAPWDAPIQATSYKPACIQQPFGSAPTPHGESEDCLYANVYTPPGTTSSSEKAVMLWIYGGNLQSGDSSIDTYDGSSFAANQDVIVVTFNYSISAFGFSNSPQIPTGEQNVGFYDQRHMLDWVQSNIAAFGGDPKKVTIFGQSAGGYSVKYLLAYPPSPLPYRSAIMESEATFILGNGTESWLTLATELGCDLSGDVLACVRAANATEIQSIVVSKSLGFAPEEDGKTYISDPLPRFANHEAAQVSVLLGSNGQEASVIASLLGLDGTSLIQLAGNLSQVLPGLGGTLAMILSATLPNNPVSVLVTNLFTSLIFTCPTSQLAQTIQDAGQSTWRYWYNASIPNIEATAGYADAGAFHTAEIPEVFGTYSRVDATQFQADLSVYMQTRWASFAQDSSEALMWPDYSNKSVAILGSNDVVEQTASASLIDYLCPLLAPVIDLAALPDLISETSPGAAALVQMMNFATVNS